MMRIDRARGAGIALAAAFTMALAVSAASANHLSLSNRNFRMTWTSLSFLGAGGLEATVRCPTTLEGSFHYSTFTKSAGALVGQISRASIASGSCTGGHATFLAETLPWHRTYEAFSGTLPNITGIHYLMHRIPVQVEFGLGVSCLYQEDGIKRERIWIVVSRGVESSPRWDSSARLPKSSGSELCPPELGMEGVGTQTVLGGTASITVTLI